MATEDEVRSVLSEVVGASRAVREGAYSWHGGPNVVGIGLAERVTAAEVLPDVALKVYVARKLPASQLAPEHLVPTSVASRGGGSEVPTDVEAIGMQRFELFADRVRPVLPGYSLGLLGGETGTLGCVVALRSAPQAPLYLSNSHVLASYSLAPKGAGVIQPGHSDGGGSTDQVATLAAAVTFDFGDGFNNTCDAAVAAASAADEVSAAIPVIGVPKPPATVTRGARVQKSGRTTGHTVGSVTDVDYHTKMLYPTPRGDLATAGFRSQVLCTRYSAGGDSGALVCDMDGAAVGLHWCGSDTTSVFSPIGLVFDALGIQLWSPPAPA